MNPYTIQKLTHLQITKLVFALAFIGLGGTTYSFADEQKVPSFLPTWRILNSEQKQQFIAGYLRGMSDASIITDIAIGYLKENPKEAVQSLTALKNVYDVSALSPSEVVGLIDRYFSETENKDKSLSAAFNVARGRLK